MTAGTPSRKTRGTTPTITREARQHNQTRRAHATEIAEDYVEMIAQLIDETGEARVVDLSKRLGVTHVTVTRTVSRLQRDGWVTARPYRSIFLTEAGRKLAQTVTHRHEIVVAFLRALGVSEETANVDAEGIEHHVSKETLAAFEKYTQATRRRL